MDSVADGVFAVDRDWNIIYFNQSAGDIARVPRSEAIGRKCHQVFNNKHCQAACLLRMCIEEDRKIVNRIVNLERLDGTRIPVSVSAAPLKDQAGEVIGGVETFRDLSGGGFVSRLQDMQPLEGFNTCDPYLTEVVKTLPLIAQSGSTVLLLGESGTGKDLFARAIHRLSERKDGPFVAVNCGALPENLIESELFGYKAGAFTDARTDKPGRFHLAEKGTIMLDEIGDLPFSLQAKILRVLQERTFEPLGCVGSVTADVRVIAATNRDLARMVAEGTFRQDLYYRLNVVQIHLHPLRERRGDIPLLVDHALRRVRQNARKDIQGISREAMHILLQYDFPGNIRELENIIEYASILCHGGHIQVEHLPMHLHPKDMKAPQEESRTMEAIRYRACLEAVERNGGNRNAACRELEISKDTLRRILQQEGKDA